MCANIPHIHAQDSEGVVSLSVKEKKCDGEQDNTKERERESDWKREGEIKRDMIPYMVSFGFCRSRLLL